MKKILFILLFLMLIGVLIISEIQYNNAVESCVNGGFNRIYCERGLR